VKFVDSTKASKSTLVEINPLSPVKKEKGQLKMQCRRLHPPPPPTHEHPPFQPTAPLPQFVGGYWALRGPLHKFFFLFFSPNTVLFSRAA
jgi:hypothetical protein